MNALVYNTISERDLHNYKRKIRRQREIRNKIVFAIISLFVILVFAFSYQTITSQAEEEVNDVTYKYFTSFEISQGDSLWSIAEEHIDYEYYDGVQEYIDEVIDINNLDDDTIQAGQCIIIPYFSNIYR